MQKTALAIIFLIFGLSIKAQNIDHSQWTTILQKYVSDDGKVNYKNLKKDSVSLTKYITYLSENVPKDNWSNQETLAYWINAYNALTVDLILKHYPIKSIKDIKNPWEQRLWKLGNKWYSLDEIEHDILRKMNDPSIHFAIVCASVSCPKLQNEAYEASKLNTQLTNATKVFLVDSTKNNITQNSLQLSKIFQWFTKDFRQNGSLIDFLNNYSDIEISENAKIKYMDYNWSLNE